MTELDLIKKNLTDDQLRQLKRSFEFYDSNHDGNITREEVRGALRALGDLQPTEADIEVGVKGLDASKDGKITFDDFILIWAKSKMGTPHHKPETVDEIRARMSKEQFADLTQQFDKYDANHDGTITREEMWKLMKANSPGASAADLEKAFAALDTNKDGTITFHDFLLNWARANPAVVSGAAIVIDCGGYSTKAGFAGETQPRVNIRTLVGHSKKAAKEKFPNRVKRDLYFGQEALGFKTLVSLKRPMELGIITRFDDMESLWDFVLRDGLRLEYGATGQSVVLTEASLNPLKLRTQMIHSFFSKFGAARVAVLSKHALALLGAGRKTGIVVDIGEDVTHVVPIVEGVTVYKAVETLEVGGALVTKHLQTLVKDKGGFWTEVQTNYELMKDIKEKVCYVCLDTKSEAPKDFDYELPDGNIVTLKSEAFSATEVLFSPTIGDKEIKSAGLAAAIVETIKKCDIEDRKALWANVILVGGVSQTAGLLKRLEKDLTASVPKAVSVKVSSFPEKSDLAWVSLSLQASHTNSLVPWITRDEYAACMKTGTEDEGLANLQQKVSVTSRYI